MNRVIRRLFFVFILSFTVAALAEPGMQEVAPGKRVYFGQSIQEVEKILGKSSQTNSSFLQRKGIDREIIANSMRFEFDSGLLCTMEFKGNFPYEASLTPFRKKWMNFDKLGTNMLQSGMSKEQFLKYLGVWEARAKESGFQKAPDEHVGDLNENQYLVQIDDNSMVNHIAIRMGTSKRSSQGGLWENGWSIFFYLESDRADGHVPDSLASIMAIGDAATY